MGILCNFAPKHCKMIQYKFSKGTEYYPILTIYNNGEMELASRQGDVIKIHEGVIVQTMHDGSIRLVFDGASSLPYKDCNGEMNKLWRLIKLD